MKKKELDFLIQEGEGYNLEFKESYKVNDSLGFEIIFQRPDLQKMSIEQRIAEHTKKVTEKVTEKQRLIIAYIKENRKVTIAEMVKKMKISRKTVAANVRQMKEKKMIKRVGPDKGGYWEVVNH